MNDPLPDRAVILSLVATLIIVFSLIFSLRPNNEKLNPTIQWRDEASSNSQLMEI